MQKQKKLLLTAVLLMSACSFEGPQSRLGGKIIKYHQSHPEQTVISIRELTDFEWDKMYVFSEAASLNEINNTLGFEYKHFGDLARRIVFVSNGKLVYREDKYYDPSERPEGKIFFRFENQKLNHMVFTRDNALFEIKEKRTSRGVYYEVIVTETAR